MNPARSRSPGGQYFLIDARRWHIFKELYGQFRPAGCHLAIAKRASCKIICAKVAAGFSLRPYRLEACATWLARMNKFISILTETFTRG